MTVKELRDALASFTDDLPVTFYDHNDGEHLDVVGIGDNNERHTSCYR
jgi:hypothetical protein